MQHLFPVRLSLLRSANAFAYHGDWRAVSEGLEAVKFDPLVSMSSRSRCSGDLWEKNIKWQCEKEYRYCLKKLAETARSLITATYTKLEKFSDSCQKLVPVLVKLYTEIGQFWARNRISLR